MDASQYYVTTLTSAFTKLGPILAFLVIGYFIFFKLPFLLFLKNMKKSKEKLGTMDVKETKQDSYSVQDYERFVRQKKQHEKEPLKLIDGEKKTKEKKKEQARGEEAKKDVPRKEGLKDPAELLFEIRPGQKVSQGELKKKYHELLRMNHPDKVASLSPEFKTLADKKTKEINDAYNKLLKRAV